MTAHGPEDRSSSSPASSRPVAAGQLTYALAPSDDLALRLAAGADVVRREPCPGDVDGWVAEVRAGRRILRVVPHALPDEPVRAELAALADGLIPVQIVPSEASSRLPLFGKRVLVTRAAHQAGSTSAMLRTLAARPVEIPAIVIGPPDDPAPLREAVRHLDRYAVLAVTSSNAVEALFAEIDAAGLDARALGHARVAAIGPGTDAALRRHGIRADVVATEHRGESLAAGILEDIRRRGLEAGCRVLLPRAAEAREVLPSELRAAGLRVDVLEAYRTRIPGQDVADRLGEALASGIDAVMFTSSSTVEHLMACVPAARERLAHVVVASIGPITSETCRRHGLEPQVEANPYTVPALIDALARHFAGR